MADKNYISKVHLPDGKDYELKDSEARDLIETLSHIGLSFVLQMLQQHLQVLNGQIIQQLLLVLQHQAKILRTFILFQIILILVKQANQNILNTFVSLSVKMTKKKTYSHGKHSVQLMQDQIILVTWHMLILLLAPQN